MAVQELETPVLKPHGIGGIKAFDCARTKHEETEGFSLIELLIVVAIIPIIAAIAIPNLFRHYAKKHSL